MSEKTRNWKSWKGRVVRTITILKRPRSLAKLLLILILPLLLFTFALTYTGSSEWDPVHEIDDYTNFAENYASLHIEVVADDDLLTSYTVNYEINYYVLTGLSIPIRFTMISTGSEPNAGIGITLESTHYVGPTSFLLGNGTWLDYDTWKYSGTIKLYTSSRQTEFFPNDVYRSQMLYVWFNSTVYPRIEMESVPRPGFEISLIDRGLADSNQIWNEMSIGQRLFVGIPEVPPISFGIETFRSPMERSYLANFSFSICLIVYWIPALTVISVKELKDRIKILSGMALSVLAFMWTLTTIVQSTTVIQNLVILVVLIWSGAEVLLQCVAHPKIDEGDS